MGTHEEAMAAVKAATERQMHLQAKQEEIELKIARRDLVKPGISFDGGREMKSDTKAFLTFVRKGDKHMADYERKALVEDATGRYIVSADIEREIFRALAAESTIRKLASVKSTDKDRINTRTITETTVGWGKLETGALIPESTLTPAESTIYIEDLYGLTKVGEDELMDSDANLVSIIADSFGKAMGTAENTAFLAGAGHASSQPDGITKDTTLLANCTTTTAAGAVTVEKFMELIYSVPTQYRKNGSMIVHSQTELALRQLRAGGSTTSDGPWLWQPSTIAGTPPTFLGFPIYTDDNMDDLSDVAGVLAIFGDFKSGYRIYDRLGIQVQRLDELYAEAGLVGFRVHMRVGGFVIKPDNRALALLVEHSA